MFKTFVAYNRPHGCLILRRFGKTAKLDKWPIYKTTAIGRGKRYFSSANTSRPAVGPVHPCIQWIQPVKRPGCGVHRTSRC